MLPGQSVRSDRNHYICFKKASLFIDFLDSETFNDFLIDPSLFSSLINSTKNKKKRVIIDEIQRLPSLLNDVYSEIQKTKRY